MNTYSTGERVIFNDAEIPELCGAIGTVVGSKRIRGHYVYNIKLNVHTNINTQGTTLTEGDILSNVRSNWIKPIEPII